jgi:TadE-like protein
MKRVTSRPGPRRGAAAVELALLLPFLLALLLGVWEVGRLIQINQVLSNAAREGARQASTGEKTNDQVKLAVCQYLKNGGLNDYTASRDSVVTVTDLNSPGSDARAATKLDRLRVTVSIPFADVQWIALHLIADNGSRLNAEAVWCSSNDQTYPTQIDSPPGY